MVKDNPLGVLFLVALASAFGCSESNSPTTPCTTSLSASLNAFGSGGGTATVQVTTAASCTWSLASDSWIVLDRNTGQGSAAVAVTVAPNPAGTPRSGKVTAGSAQVELSQSGCSATLEGTIPDFAATGGNAVLPVATTPGCRWSAQATDTWIRVDPPSGEGAGQLTITVTPNPSGATRTTNVSINGQASAVRQVGIACSYRVNPAEVLTLPHGQQDEFTIETEPLCTWTAVSEASWITVRSPGNGSGPGKVLFEASPTPSTSQQRSGTIRIQGAGASGAGSVRQLALCNILFMEPRPGGQIVPTSVPASAGGETKSFWALTEPWFCSWSAVVDVPWINIDYPRFPAVIMSDGGIRFNVEPNNTGVERRGQIRAADKILTIIQSAR